MRIGRQINLIMVLPGGRLDGHTVTRRVYRRADGSEYIVLKTLGGQHRRYTLDSPNEVFLTLLWSR